MTGFDPAPLIEGREELRRELGYRPDERVVIVTVGGSGRRRVAAAAGDRAYPEAARRVNGLRMIAVAGPRIDPASLGAPPGWRCGPSSRTCTGTWWRATSPWSRAG